MTRPVLSIIFSAGLIIFLAHSAVAQSPATKLKSPLDGALRTDKSNAKAEADRIATERRAQAQSWLISLAGDARSFRDQKLRARSLGRIADALWDVDGEQGRALFRKAWEAAETADRESKERGYLRNEVLGLAARRDRLLAEELLEKLKADQEETKPGTSRSNSWELPEASEKRLSLAKNLLATGEIERALQFADPVLGNVTISTVDFLTLLWEKDAAAADRRYGAMLSSTAGNMAADANTVSLLASYLFTPHLYVTFDTTGGANTSSRPSFSSRQANINAQLQLTFFQTAVGILLRPQPPPEQDQSSAGIAGKYMVVRRLMPLFEQYAPKEIAAAMRGQFEALSALVSEGLRQGDDEWIQKGINPEKQRLADQEHSLLDQIEHAGTSAERDQLYFRLALLALSKNEVRAREHVTRIDETEFRKRAQAWVDWGLAVKAIGKRETGTALELARSAEISHIQRLWILTQTAKLLTTTDREKALSLLDEATAEDGRIESIDLDRPRGLLAVASALALVEPSRVWDATYEAIKAANSSEGFTGEDGTITVTVNSESLILKTTDPVPDFDLAALFGKLASSDYERAIQLARGFQGEAPRANATIAISKAILNEKVAAAPKQQPPRKT
ncbi:MAG TPA: hypothetical protein VGO56_16490 [Pyrinomonadaceae bacterium]|jgi:hypothetical protein|nr:hypothetical protein [Pyrinomonadaceae bacterium]